MKILIVTMTCGEGHNAIARSIAEGFDARDEVKTVNLYAHLGKRDRLGKGYLLAAKYIPNLYSAIWDRLRKINPARRYRGAAMEGVRLALDEMERVAAAFAPDAVICTHPYASNVFCYLKIHNRYRGRIYSVLTDYVVCPYWQGSVLCDGVFTPHAKLHSQMLARGFREEQLLPFGLPVRGEFEYGVSKAAARAELGIAEQEFVVVSVNGGLGVGNVRGLIAHAATVDAQEKTVRLFVVCGRNERLRRRAEKFVCARGYENVTVLGFTQELSVLYAAADFVFCRGGSGAVTEAAKTGVSFAVRERAVTQERANAEFFKPYGCYAMKRVKEARRILQEQLRMNTVGKSRGGYDYRTSCQGIASRKSSLISVCASENNLKYYRKKREANPRAGGSLHAFFA